LRLLNHKALPCFFYHKRDAFGSGGKEYRKAMYDWAKENYQDLTDKEIANTLGFSRLDILLK